MNTKKEMIKAGLGLTYILLLIGIVRFFELKFWSVFALLMVTTIIWSLIKKNFTIKSTLKSAMYLLVIMYVMRLLSPFGIWGYIISVSLICTLVIWKRRQKFIEVKAHIESMIWGEPLNNFIQRGEKPPRIRLKR